MAEYNLARVTVMLVEDNAFIHQTLDDMLRHFRVEKISKFKNGEEAIVHLKALKLAGDATPDIIISDLIMSPINGQLLLRWVRTAKESPNRFVPFIMISGAADRDFVASVRDLGVSEFLAKPFSVQTVFSHLSSTIERPRPFVATKGYFGPDRRRLRGEGLEVAEERRRLGDSHITHVYSADKMVRPKLESDVWYFHLPNKLKEKVGGGGADDGPPTLPDDILEKAEETLQRAAMDFSTWASDYLEELSSLCNEAEAVPERRRRLFGEICLLAHELRGQGGTFGYPLVSEFGKMLYEATLDTMKNTDNQVEIVAAHIDAMRVVLRDKIAGDGDDVGKEVQATLQAAIQRYLVTE